MELLFVWYHLLGQVEPGEYVSTCGCFFLSFDLEDSRWHDQEFAVRAEGESPVESGEGIVVEDADGAILSALPALRIQPNGQLAFVGLAQQLEVRRFCGVDAEESIKKRKICEKGVIHSFVLCNYLSAEMEVMKAPLGSQATPCTQLL